MKQLYFVLLVNLVGLSFSQSLDVIWKAQALESVEKLDSLTRCLEEKRCKDSRAYQIEAAIHKAYTKLAAPEAGLHKKVSKRAKEYHVVIDIRKDLGVLDIGFIYDPETEELLGPRVDRLPKGWSVVPKTFGGVQILAFKNYEDEKEPSLIFLGDAPFTWKVSEPD